MPSKKKNPSRKNRRARSKKLVKHSEHHETHPHLPGYLMIAFGLLGLSVNFDLINGLDWAKAYPLLVVLFGFVVLVKVSLARSK
ncbi:hypothetical protein KKF81_00820 [Candidatus Micrarchaeota archaeon]|nr:hypothetical protein [Candidatus Micrarchaeota archaeon]MBU1165462.1 hypothetical protein [Candidatus Micrarchaeota archaeon]MBU1887443.1 hypothetical protein [Candidatus Micrarchaeota archaeon]